MRIPIKNENADAADVPGGERTAPQDAGEALEEVTQTRIEEGNTQQQQERGEVETQTKDLKPSAANPEHGLPPNPSGKENSGGSDENATDGEAENDAADNAHTVAEHEEKFLRLAADFENYKRQAARREQEVRERTARNVVEDLLPVLDNFERALDAARNARDVESLRTGLELVAQQMQNSLRNIGLEPIPAAGEKFDPLHHEAIAQVSDTDVESGTIIGEVQSGYSYKGQVLRPALVRVAG